MNQLKFFLTKYEEVCWQRGKAFPFDADSSYWSPEEKEVFVKMFNTLDGVTTVSELLAEEVKKYYKDELNESV